MTTARRRLHIVRKLNAAHSGPSFGARPGRDRRHRPAVSPTVLGLTGLWLAFWLAAPAGCDWPSARPTAAPSAEAAASTAAGSGAAEDPHARAGEPSPVLAELRALLPEMDDSSLVQLADQYGNTAVNVARQHGQAGAEVILAWGAQGVAVMREQPDTFDKLAARLSGPTAATCLVHLHRHFQELASGAGLPGFLDRVESLPSPLKALARKYPAMLPFLVLAPEEAHAALQAEPDLCLACFPAVDLRPGPAALRRVARMIVEHGPRARDWVQARGLDGLLLADSFPCYLQRPPPMELPVFLEILSQNQDDVAALVQAGRQEEIWPALAILVREDGLLPEQPAGEDAPPRGSWLTLACDDEHTLRFLLDYGTDGVRVLKQVWPDTYATGVTLPGLLYEGYRHEGDPAELRAHAWQSLLDNPWGARQSFQMLLLMASRPGQDPATIHPRCQQFRQLLGRLDHRVVAYLAEAEAAGSLTATRYARLMERGLDELQAWSAPPSMMVEMLPLYDVVHLGWVLAKGYTPTHGEVVFACVDAGFTAWDIATLGAGKSLTSAAKITAKGGAALSRELVEVGRQAATKAAVRGLRDAGPRLTTALAARLSRSPRVVLEIAARKLYRDLPVAAAKAARSALKKRIPLVALRYTAREWTLNMAVGGSLLQLAKHAAGADNSLWSEKTREVLLYLGGAAEQAFPGP